jgi:hypothetical protein
MITATGSLGINNASLIDLKKLFIDLLIDETFVYAEYCIGGKKFAKGKKDLPRKKSSKTSLVFENQLTLSLHASGRINVKVFCNGKLQVLNSKPNYNEQPTC